MSSPPISVPITLPRSASLASVAAYGTSICTTTEVMPASVAAKARTGRFGASAQPTRVTVQIASRPVSSGRRRVMSPAGTMSSSPTA